MDENSTKSSSSAYPVNLTFRFPATQSRLLALFSIPFFLARLVLLIPQFIVLYFLQIVAIVGAWANFWVILFTGKGSSGIQNFVSGTLRWSTRVSAYMFGLSDKYPPFTLNN